MQFFSLIRQKWHRQERDGGVVQTTHEQGDKNTQKGQLWALWFFAYGFSHRLFAFEFGQFECEKS